VIFLIPLRALPYEIYGDRLVIDFLRKDKDYENLKRAIKFVKEELRDRAVSQFFILSKLYKFLGDLRKARLVLHGLKYFLATKQLCGINHSILLKFFELVQENYHGFIALESRKKAMDHLSHQLEIPREDLAKALIYDNIRLFYFEEKKHLDPDKLLKICNFLILEKIISMSEYVKIFFPKRIAGAVLKKSVWRVKQAGILASFDLTKDQLICTYEGPLSIFGTSIPYHYQRALSFIVINSLWKFKPWKTEFVIRIRKRNFRIKISSESYWAPDFVPLWIIDAKEKPQLRRFDSKEEKMIFNIIRRVCEGRNITVERETSLITLSNGRIFLPDFTIRKGNKEVYVEVIGFWTAEYHKRKLEKLQQLWREGVTDLFLFINDRLRNIYFQVPFRKFFYKTTKEGVKQLERFCKFFLEGV